MQTIARTTFTTVKTEGAILPADLLQRVADNRDLKGLAPTDYHLLPGERLNEAINRSWNRCLGVWRSFDDHRASLPETESGVTLTRERWLLILFQELGYGRLPYRGRLTIETPAIGDKDDIEGLTYPISHHWDHAPIHLVSFRQDPDRRDPSTKRSPHSLLQEFLNRSEASLWGFVSNGLRLRVLRDNVSLTRAAYLEFDLEAMMRGELYADFSLLWLMCHQSRVEGTPHSSCWLETWSQEAAAQGTRALDALRQGVQEAISALGRGFLAHPANRVLVERLKAGELNAQDYYRQLLRLVYRLIFMFVAEDRDLLLRPDADDRTRRLYTDFYSVRRLRLLAETRRGGPHPDLYRTLRLVFTQLRTGYAELGLPALGGFLFSKQATPDLDETDLENTALLEAIRALAFTIERRVRRPVDYRNLGAEELGSVYESLLELHPQLNADAATFDLSMAAGSERKTTGSYYTPSSLIYCLLDSALEPVVADRLRSAKDREEAILNIKVVDPACGSGHFLIAAAHRLARHLARVRTHDVEPAPAELRVALRDVVRNCIHGVDINPMAVELCKVALWMETLDPGRPLSFLDRNIQCGNSLIGATPALLDNGIPNEAFKPITGDNKAYCQAFRKRNKEQRAGQLSLFSFDMKRPWTQMGNLAASMKNVLAAADETVEDVRQEQELYESIVHSKEYRAGKLWADAWCAAFVWKKTDEFPYPITEEEFRNIGDNPSDVPVWMKKEIGRLAAQYQFFHWHLAFPHVFMLPEGGAENEQAGWDGGFDVVLGNPPWEKIQAEEQAFFASLAPSIAGAVGAKRKRMIADLEKNDLRLFGLWSKYKRQIATTDRFLKNSQHYTLTGIGKLNTYAVFAELATILINISGAVGIVVPLGIITDYYTKDFFWYLMQHGLLHSLFGFENEEFLFPEVHHSFKFAIIHIVGKLRMVSFTDFVFFCRQSSETRDQDRHFSLSASDIALLNPNTRNCSIFRSSRDFRITRQVYDKFPIIKPDKSPGLWSVGIHRIVNPTDDSGSMLRLDPDPEIQHERLIDDQLYVPVYEAKMMHQFDHRFGSYVGQTPAQARQGKLPELSESEHQNPYLCSQTRYWMKHEKSDPWLTRYTLRQWLMVYRDITSPVVLRTSISCIIPRMPPVDPCRCIFFDASLDNRLACCFLAAMNSYIFDYVCRQKFSGTHLAIFILKQLVVPPPNIFVVQTMGDQSIGDWVYNRVLELTYTAWDLQPFAQDCGYDGPPFRWDAERRFLLRCELDAAYFHLYGIVRDDVAYIMETFPIVKRRDIAAHGEYRTKRVILEIYDAMRQAMEGGGEYRTRLVPPPADPGVAHPGALRRNSAK